MLNAKSWPPTLNVTSWTSSPVVSVVVIRCGLRGRPGRGSARGLRPPAPPHPPPTAASARGERTEMDQWDEPPAQWRQAAYGREFARNTEHFRRIADLQHPIDRETVRFSLRAHQQITLHR